MIILVLLIGLTTVALTTTRSGILEQLMTNNDGRAKEVQEAGEAALEYSLAWSAKNPLPWRNTTDSVIDCSNNSDCPTLPTSFTGNDNTPIAIQLRFDRNPATANFIKVTASATQIDNHSRAVYSICITQNGTRIPGTWRDF